MFIIKAVYLVWYMYRRYLSLIQGALAEQKKIPFSSQYVYHLLNTHLTRRDDQE